jgi:hypothetical protein
MVVQVTPPVMDRALRGARPAPEHAVTEFAAAQAAMWAEIGADAPHCGLAAAAAGWHQHRMNP